MKEVVLFKSIRKKIGKSILKRKLKNFRREKQLYSFGTSQIVGVLFKTNTQGDFEIVKKFLHFLSEQDNKVVALCFVDYKKVPDYYFLRKGFNFFSRSDLSTFLLPKTQFIVDFISKPFDILIDLSTEENFPLTYISSLSQAKLKVGKLHNGNNNFDVMIDTSKDNSVQSLIEQIKHYIPVLCGESCLSE
jgi:hypothetical protein